MARKTFKELIQRAKQRDSYWIAKAIHDFTEDLYQLMDSRAVSKTELAKKIGSSPAYITKVLRGDTNFTIESMVRLVRALDGQLRIHVGKQEDHVRWFDVIQAPRVPAEKPEGFKPVSRQSLTITALLQASIDDHANTFAA